MFQKSILAFIAIIATSGAIAAEAPAPAPAIAPPAATRPLDLESLTHSPGGRLASLSKRNHAQ